MKENSLKSLISDYLIYLEKERNVRKSSLKQNRFALTFIEKWSIQEGISRVNMITLDSLIDFQSHISHYLKKSGDPLSLSTQQGIISRTKGLFTWLNRNNHILYNPAKELELPKRGNTLPRCILSVYEVEKIINQTNIQTQRGIRDRAILETFYSTGIRKSELVELSLTDVNFSRGTLMVRQGKGNKDRLIPIGERAIKSIEKYLSDARPYFIKQRDSNEKLFISIKGESLSPSYLGNLVTQYINKAEIGKTGSCHLFRHSMATHMLENGANIRYVQQMLGHSSINTTEIYTHVTISKLKEIHKTTHPEAYKTTISTDTAPTPISLESMNTFIDNYLSLIKTQNNYSKRTLKGIELQIKTFLDFSNINSPKQINPNHFFLYESHVYTLKNKNGKSLDSVSQYNRLKFAKNFLKYLYENRYIDFTIEKEVEKPNWKVKRTEILTINDIEKIIQTIDIRNYVGLRDRAMLELVYSSGIKRNELLELTLSNLNIEEKTITIKNSRVIPITDRAIYFLEKYLKESRNKFVKKDSNYLFLSQKSAKCNIILIIKLFEKYSKKALLNKDSNCKVFTESFKAFLKENGAKNEFINTMLGKDKSLSLDDLKRDFYKYHPAYTRVIIEEDQEKPSLLQQYLFDYLDWLRIKNFSKQTLKNKKHYIKKFLTWCLDQGITDPKDVSNEILRKYQRDMYDKGHEKSKEPLSLGSKQNMISCVINFFSYLVKMNRILYNPGGDIILPTVPKSLPSNILTEEEVISILSQVDITNNIGIRDRAILETFHSTGIRNIEMSYIRLEDINLEEETVIIRHGKGNNQRMIPLGKIAAEWIDRYINEVRPLCLKDTTSDYLFLTLWGTKLSKISVHTIVKEYIKKAGITKVGSSILFRHTMATQMLENGADIRYIQQMLGHKRIKTTQIYTHISIGKLKEVHENTHPAKPIKTQDNLIE
jgi:integrase/recombinase XerD